MGLLVIVVAATASALPSAVAQPSTVFQCKKHFKPGAQRTACIKRVTAKPGSSCSKPLFSGEAVDGATIDGSDTKDYVVSVRELGPVRNPGSPEPVGLQLEVDVKNPRIEICRAIIITYPPDRVTGTSEPLKKTDHIVHIPSHGGSSETVSVPGNDAWGGIVYARVR